jgi:adhesin transport system outer membrane protein
MNTQSNIIKYTLWFVIGVSYYPISLAQTKSDKASEISDNLLEVKKETSMAVMRELVLQSIMRNPELAQAEAENRQILSKWKQIRAGVLPQATITMGYGQENRNYSLTNSDSRYKDQYQVQLRLSQPLMDATLAARIRQTKAQALGGDWSLVSVREQTMLKAIELYAELVRQSSLVVLARENLKLHRQYVGQMKEIARVDLGRASDLPVAQSRVSLAESVLTVRLARLETTRAQWRAHTTLPSPEQSAVGAEPITLFTLPSVDWPLSIDEAIFQAVEASPQLQKVLTETVVSQETLQVARAATLPKLNVEIQNQRANNFGGIFGAQRSWYTGLNMQWAWDAGAVHNSHAALSGIRASEEAVDSQVLKIKAAVESQWFELQASQAVLESYEAYEEQSSEVVQSYAEQFRIGRRSLLDVLNAENELFTARSNALTTRVDVSLASWRLLSLRGLLSEELGL